MPKIIINGQGATFADLQLLNKLKKLNKIKIVFFRVGKKYINIITD